MSQFQLYGMNEAGETAWSEVLQEADRQDLRALAAARLQQWHAVEIWEGPICLVRIRRPGAAEGQSAKPTAL